MVRRGEQADPRVAAPHALMPILRFGRLSSAAYDVISRAVDADPDLRARVAAEAQEGELGRVGWLWLHRPEGWLSDPAWTAEPVLSGARSDKARDRTESVIAQLRRVAEKAEADRRRAVKEAAESKRAAENARVQVGALKAGLAAVSEQRNRAMRAAKGLEGDLGEARRNLKAARQAALESEAELLALRHGDPTFGSGSGTSERPAFEPAAFGSDQSSDEFIDWLMSHDAAGPSPDRPAPRQGAKRRERRATPPLPPGVFAATAEGHRHLVSAGRALIVVDGYNLARAAWSGLSPQEERRRTVAMLEEVRARSGGEVVVVFDGDSTTVAPLHSRSVRVRFSATGVTADDFIVGLLADLPRHQPVLVVSSDRAVAADARREGATVLSSQEFLLAVRRS